MAIPCAETIRSNDNSTMCRGKEHGGYKQERWQEGGARKYQTRKKEGGDSINVILMIDHA